MNWETFQTAYQNAPVEKQTTASSDVIPSCVAKAVADGRVDQTQAKAVIQLFSILFLDPNQKETVLAEIKTAGVPNGEELVKELGFCVASSPAEDSLESEIQEAEEALAGVPKIRTMASDMQNHQPTDVTYTSTQAAILKEGEQQTPS